MADRLMIGVVGFFGWRRDDFLFFVTAINLVGHRRSPGTNLELLASLRLVQQVYYPLQVQKAMASAILNSK